jgi:GTP cyclohydrolase II
LKHEGVKTVRLLTNNPAKMNALTKHGIPATDMPLALEERDFKKLTAHMSEEDTEQLIAYLRVKGEKLGQTYLTSSIQRILQEVDPAKGSI